MSFHPVPKPTAEQVSAFMRSGARKGLQRKTPLSRGTKPLRADPIKTRAWRDRSRKPLPQVNRAKEQRRKLNYNAVIRSDFHKKLRYDAYLRAGGFCECDRCVKVREVAAGWDGSIEAMAEALRKFPRAQVDAALTPTPVWFTKKGTEPWRRFRSDAGEVHHDSYKYFGDENPAELEVVRWTWDAHHQEIEATFGTRRRFLTGKATA